VSFFSQTVVFSNQKIPKKEKKMKRYIVLIALGLILVFSGLVQAENLVENGGFEYDMYGWQIINELGNTLKSENNSSSYTAIEGGKNLHVVITNPDAVNAWRTSIKYPISIIMTAGEKWVLKFTVKKLSAAGVISAGLMDNRPPWQSFFWTGDLDLSRLPVGSAVDYQFEFELPYDVWYPAVVLNLAGQTQDIRLDDVRVERKSQIALPSTTHLSGKIVNLTKTTFYKLYVVVYPEGDAAWGDVNAKIVPVNADMTWSTDVAPGKRYSAELFTQTMYVYKRITKPWVWTISANSAAVSGIDFSILGNYYKSSTSWLTIQDPMY
jgi:hypothetical protein